MTEPQNDMDRLRDWITKANAVAGIVVEWRTVLAECRMKQELAVKDSNPRAVEKHKAEVLYAARQLSLGRAMLLEATETSDLRAATTMLLDIKVATQATVECYESWRKIVFLSDVLKANYEITDGCTPDQADAKADQLHDEYVTALEFALALIPGDTELERISL